MRNWQQETFFLRANILDLIRAWFKAQGYLEVETPVMAKFPGMEPDLDLFSTEFVSKDGKCRQKQYLLTSPEYAMKKLLSAGFEKIFQISKAFRNGEEGSLHRPEFTMLEFYRAHADYFDLMQETEAMIRWVATELPVSDGMKKLLASSWERLSVREAFKKFAGMNLDELKDKTALQAQVLGKGYQLSASYSWDDLFFLILLNEIVPKLGFGKPVFLYDYPSTQAALSKKKTQEPFWAERFELYVNGIELCNAFSELNDPVEQRSRLVQEQEIRRSKGKEVPPLNEEFLEALKTMPQSTGNALGVDRLVMLLLEKSSLQEVML